MASVAKGFEREVDRPRSTHDLVHRFVCAMPTRCDHCGGRVVRTDPMRSIAAANTASQSASPRRRNRFGSTPSAGSAFRIRSTAI